MGGAAWSFIQYKDFRSFSPSRDGKAHYYSGWFFNDLVHLRERLERLRECLVPDRHRAMLSGPYIRLLLKPLPSTLSYPIKKRPETPQNRITAQKDSFSPSFSLCYEYKSIAKSLAEFPSWLTRDGRISFSSLLSFQGIRKERERIQGTGEPKKGDQLPSSCSHERALYNTNDASSGRE